MSYRDKDGKLQAIWLIRLRGSNPGDLDVPGPSILYLPTAFVVYQPKKGRTKEETERARTTTGTVDREERRPLHPRAPRREIRILRGNRAELRKGVSFHAPDRRYVYSYVSLARIFSVTLLHAALFVHFASPPPFPSPPT